VWLGDNSLRLDFAEFRNQHKCILPLEFYIKSMIRIWRLRVLLVCYHMIKCLLCCMFIICFKYLLAMTCWKLFYTSLPFIFVFVLFFGFSFCDDHQILGVSRCGDSWWSWCWRGGCGVVRLPRSFIAHCWAYFLVYCYFVVSCFVSKFSV